jgi:hypothetical protein
MRARRIITVGGELAIGARPAEDEKRRAEALARRGAWRIARI